MRLHVAFLTCVLFLTITCIYAQETDFKDGFIVKSGQSYTYGLVSFASGNEKHSNVYFKASANSPPTTYHPEEIEAYGLINQNHFRSRPVTTNGVSTKVFLEAIVDGKVVVYTFDKRIFIERGDSFYELKNTGSQSAYQSILTSLLQDCPSAAKKAKKIAIELNKVADLAKSYNSCFDDGLPSKDRSVQIIPEAFVGLDRTSFSLSEISNEFMNEKAFRDLTLLHGGVNITFRFVNARIGIQSGAWWSDQRFSLAPQESSSSTSVQVAQVNLTSIRMPLLLRYEFKAKSKIHSNVKAGVVFSRSISSETYYQSEVDENNVVTIDRYAISSSLTEPIQYYLACGVTAPVWKKIYVFSEIWISAGKKAVKVNEPLTGGAMSHFTGYGVNVGVRFDIYATKN
jgi:hypothetical protein